MPTIKQKRAFTKVLKGSSISQAMRDVGYSETTASTTGKLTNTQGWQELLDTYLPDDLLVQTALEGLGSTKILTSGTEPNVEVKDMPTRHKYLETTLKMKNKIKDEPQGDVKIMILRLDA